MLSFPSQNIKKYFQPAGCTEKKTDPADGKPTYFSVWPNLRNLIYFLQQMEWCA